MKSRLQSSDAPPLCLRGTGRTGRGSTDHNTELWLPRFGETATFLPLGGRLLAYWDAFGEVGLGSRLFSSRPFAKGRRVY